jgi:hypothetical protein
LRQKSTIQKEGGTMKKLLMFTSTIVLVVGFTTQVLAQEWSEPNWADLRLLNITFDKIELFVYDGNQTFVCPAFEDPHDPSSNPMAWEGNLVNPGYILATGTATQAVGWTDHFSGPQSEPFTMTLLAWSGGTYVFGGDAYWNGSSYDSGPYWTDPGDDPHPGVYDRTEEWSQQDWANLIPLALSFDKMELFITDGNQTYVNPGADDFRDQYNVPNAWSAVLCHANYVLAIGPTTQYVRWFDHLSGPWHETFTLTGIFWLDDTFVLGQDAVWNGCDGWTQLPYWTDPGDDPHPGAYDRTCTVPNNETTWGRVKAMYR